MAFVEGTCALDMVVERCGRCDCVEVRLGFRYAPLELPSTGLAMISLSAGWAPVVLIAGTSPRELEMRERTRETVDLVRL